MADKLLIKFIDKFPTRKFDKITKEEILEEFSEDEIKKILEYVDRLYFIHKDPDNLILDDFVYDTLCNLFNHEPSLSEEEEKLKFSLVSERKIYDNESGESELKRWLEKNKKKVNIVIISEKIDGVCLLFRRDSVNDDFTIFAKNTSKTGRNINDKFRDILYLKYPDLKNSPILVFRAEASICKEDFEAINRENKTNKISYCSPRNIITSNFFSKNNPDYSVLDKINIIAYEVNVIDFKKCDDIKSSNEMRKYYKRLELAKKYIDIVNYIYIENKNDNSIDIKYLSKVYDSFVSKSKYIIDGIVIRPCKFYEMSEFVTTSSKHPFSISFKKILPPVESEVIGITYTISKDKKITPILHIKEIMIDGRCIKKLSGKNIDYLRDKNISYGAKILISLNITPNISGVTKKATDEDMERLDDEIVEKERSNDFHREAFSRILVGLIKKLGAKGISFSLMDKLFPKDKYPKLNYYSIIEYYNKYEKIGSVHSIATHLHEVIHIVKNRKVDLLNLLIYMSFPTITKNDWPKFVNKQFDKISAEKIKRINKYLSRDDVKLFMEELLTPDDYKKLLNCSEELRLYIKSFIDKKEVK